MKLVIIFITQILYKLLKQSTVYIAYIYMSSDVLIVIRIYLSTKLYMGAY